MSPNLPLLLPTVVLTALLGTACATAQSPSGAAASAAGPAPMTELIERYQADDSSLRRFYDIDVSPTRLARLDAFEQD